MRAGSEIPPGWASDVGLCDILKVSQEPGPHERGSARLGEGDAEDEVGRREISRRGAQEGRRAAGK